MAVSVIPVERPPSEIVDGQGGESAQVIPLFPSPDERGFLLPGPGQLIRGATRAASAVANTMLGMTLEMPERPSETVVLSDSQGREHLFLVTDPDPEMEVNLKEAPNIVFFPGLTEMGDVGSAPRLHNEYARQHPGVRVITRTTEGVSHMGKPRHWPEGGDRLLEDIAADTLTLLPRLTEEGPVELAGTSLGTFTVMRTAEQDLAANPHKQLNINRLTLMASAVIARDVPDDEYFRDTKVNEDEMRAELTKRFLLHIYPDLGRMIASKPVAMLGCAPIIGAYALFPGKAAARARAIREDFQAVQEGIEWSSLKQVVSEHEVWVLGGERDPLVQFQIPQWNAVSQLFPGQVKQRIVKGRGHLMTADAKGTIKHLDQMEDQHELALAA